MSTWSEIFPILHDELLDSYETEVTANWRQKATGWFEVGQVINKRPEAKHIVSVSLFLKNIRTHEREIVLKTRKDFMQAKRKHRVLRFEPWSYYVMPLLRGAYRLQDQRPEVAVRVYLAADLKFLIPDLLEANCEIYLMKSRSIRHNPGAMWRFLALAEKRRLVTVVDADRMDEIETDIARTEHLPKIGLNWWRVPVWGEFNEIKNVSYRPMLGMQFGSQGGATNIRQMMEALIWAVEKKKIDTYAQIPGKGPQPIHGTVWPDYGFDEWFLLSTLYPRAAYDGMFTYVPYEAESRLLPLDIHYVSQANPANRMIYFVSPQMCCAPGEPCGPVDKVELGKKVKRKDKAALPIEAEAIDEDRDKVLLTGFWQVANESDVILINELCEYAQAQNMAVEIKPILHVKNQKLLAKIPQRVVKEGLIWKGSFNTHVQKLALNAMGYGQKNRWIWQADTDERVDFKAMGGLRKMIQKAEKEKADYIDGEWVDRIAMGDVLPRLEKKRNLAKQFPRVVYAVKYFSQAYDRKVALRQRTCDSEVGNHEPLNKTKKKASFEIPIWHFKWHSHFLVNQKDKIESDATESWAWQMKQSVQKIVRNKQGDMIRWSELPEAAWPSVRKHWKKGAYPVM